MRLLVPADVPAYRALMLHAYEHAADAFTSTAAERAQEPQDWWARRIAHPAGLALAFGLFEHGALAGTVALEFSAKPKTRHKALLIGMYLLPQARGLGHAGALVDAALQHCRARGDIRVVVLEATEGNEPALGLYESRGFSRFGLEPMAIRTPGGFRAKVHMALVL